MKAAILRDYGDQPVSADVDRPSLPADSVMVEVHASSCNPIDAIIMRSSMREQMELDLPWIVGYDVSGVVTEVGSDVDTFDVGDEVFVRADGASVSVGDDAEEHLRLGAADTRSARSHRTNVSRLSDPRHSTMIEWSAVPVT